MHEEVRKEFQEKFKAYKHPFEHSDELLLKMDVELRKAYYEKALFLRDNQVLKQEITEWKRKFYTELAVATLTDVERTALRKTLIAIQDFEKRLHTLGQYAVKQESKQNIANKL